MDRLDFVILISGFVIALALFASAGTLYFRSRMIPMCWSCGAWKTAPSRELRRLDFIPLLLLLTPVRCIGCFRRFYTFRFVKPQVHRPAWQKKNMPLNYVDQSSTTLALLYALFPPAGHHVTVRLRLSLGSANSRSKAQATASASSGEQGPQLNNLLDALVQEKQAADEHPVSKPTETATPAITRS